MDGLWTNSYALCVLCVLYWNDFFINSKTEIIEQLIKVVKIIKKIKKFINFHNIGYLLYGFKIKDNSDKVVAGTSLINIKLFGRL